MQNSKKFKLPDTGQVRCYDEYGKEIESPQPGEDNYGQNGCFFKNAMSFAKLDLNGKELPDHATWDDGLRMVVDNNTGLVWEVKSPVPDEINYCDDEYSWEDAQEVYIKKLNERKHCGYDDWRIPNKDELRSIVDYGKTNPAIDSWYFPNCQIALYWCSASFEMQPCFGWVIFFGLGSATANGKSIPRHVRAVRGGFNKLFGAPDLSRFTDNDDGTITDSATGLMWQKGENERMSWFEAIKFCQKLKLAGYDDWRLPNIKEINTILDVSYKDNWWHFKDFFPAEGLEPPLLHYSSSSVFEKTYAWVTNFCFGYDGYYAPKDAGFLLCRAVRDITPVKKSSAIFKFPDTGQVRCYDDEGNQIPAPKEKDKFFGQDGSFNIEPMSFTKMRGESHEITDDSSWENALRLIKDNNTGLIWEVKSPNPGEINYMNDKYNWHDAQAYIERLNKKNYGGFDDWRMPNREELRTIVNYNDTIPAIDRKYFPNTAPDFYWSKDRKEPYTSNLKMVWGIYFAYGCSICYLQDTPFFVRAVRGGYNRAFGDVSRYAFKDNGDGTITDSNTGLMWKKDENPDMNLVDALKYCRELRFGGYDDWRLPNMRELPTLLDLSFKDSTWFHKEFFPNVKTKPLGFYWSSSTFGATFGWGVNFQLGYDGYYAAKKQGHYPFRPVRIIKQI